MTPDLFTSVELARAGANLAADHADRMTPHHELPWSGQAYAFLLYYMTEHERFQGEDVRMAAEGKVPDPPDKRAWGAVILTALRNGLIVRDGYELTSSLKSHATPRAIWRVVRNNIAA